jgi:hypothetical protein
MIRLTDVTNCAVADAPLGNLVLYAYSSKERLPCIPVKYDGETGLLALNVQDKSGNKSPLFLEGIATSRCIVLGKAEFYMPADLVPVPYHSAGVGYLVLGSNGLAIMGRAAKTPPRGVDSGIRSWQISSGEVVRGVEAETPCAGAWEVGVYNESRLFEKVLSFPFA